VDERAVMTGLGISSPKLALENTTAQRRTIVEQSFIPM
jgi:hypothetical protein